MSPKPCSLCRESADFAFVLLASTLRLRLRLQRSSNSIAICEFCLRDFIKFPECRSKLSLALQLKDALTTCYQALTHHSSKDPYPTSTKGRLNANSQATTRPTTELD